VGFIFRSIGHRRRRRRVRARTRQAHDGPAGEKQCERIRLTGVSRVRLLYTHPTRYQTLYGQILILLYLHNIIILHIVQTKSRTV